MRINSGRLIVKVKELNKSGAERNVWFFYKGEQAPGNQTRQPATSGKVRTKLADDQSSQWIPPKSKLLPSQRGSGPWADLV